MLASRYGVPEPSDIIFDNDTRVSSIAGSSAAPSTAGAAQRVSVSQRRNRVPAKMGGGGREGWFRGTRHALLFLFAARRESSGQCEP